MAAGSPQCMRKPLQAITTRVERGNDACRLSNTGSSLGKRYSMRNPTIPSVADAMSAGYRSAPIILVLRTLAFLQLFGEIMEVLA